MHNLTYTLLDRLLLMPKSIANVIQNIQVAVLLPLNADTPRLTICRNANTHEIPINQSHGHFA